MTILVYIWFFGKIQWFIGYQISLIVIARQPKYHRFFALDWTQHPNMVIAWPVEDKNGGPEHKIHPAACSCCSGSLFSILQPVVPFAMCSIWPLKRFWHEKCVECVEFLSVTQSTCSTLEPFGSSGLLLFSYIALGTTDPRVEGSQQSNWSHITKS